MHRLIFLASTFNTKSMLTSTMRLTTRQWMLPIEGNGDLARAVRMLQKKVKQLDEEIAGDYEHPLDTEEELTSNAPATRASRASTATMPSMQKDKKEEIRYYYVMREPFDKKHNTFFSGYVKTAEEYVIK